jgi:RNA-directed DNA polymerase
MKRYNHLWGTITSFENLLLAARKAQRGKRFRPNILEFNDRLEDNLLQLQQELLSHSYQPGAYRTFEIVDPKPRIISAAPYRDRVIHHAILKTQLHQKIKCPDTLWLIDTIIDNSNPQGSPYTYFAGDDLLNPLDYPKGLPIGNLTSQFFANVYLNGFDRFIKETLLAPKYLRYVDDFALFSDDRAFLVDARQSIEAYLVTLRLQLHPMKVNLSATRCGANFVGFRVLPDRIRIKGNNLYRARYRLKKLTDRLAQGRMTESEVRQSIASWQAHLNHADTWRLQQKIFDQ